ncbi:CgeB family protein [Ruegeria atlantica]|uniref:CgeB family protein n=1 Tax=Ruegeria atlantica TaxID=81569 RepID=UPI00148012F3|nr:glycosyltransferase [Ruegeria atlantica]
MKILYIGAKSGTSLQRAEATRRLGHDVLHISPEEFLPNRWPLWLNRQGGFGIDHLVSRVLKREIGNREFDLAHVNSGEVIGRKSVAVLGRTAPVLSHYTSDNPYASPTPERKRWNLFLQVLDQYDLTASTNRDGSDQNMRNKGARNPFSAAPCADEVVHRPFDTILEQHWLSEVAFVGTWMPGREFFMETLIDAGIELSIYGPRWTKAVNHAKLKPYLRGNYLEGRDYTAAIAGAKIALVLLNEKNFDTYTKRSIEIPAIGTAMCAARTRTHEALYTEDQEAVFFDTAEDCVDRCKALLANPRSLAALAQAGQARAHANGFFNENLMAEIIDRAMDARI